MTEPGPGGLRPSADSVLRIAELRWILVARASNAVGSSALLTVLGYQVYELTRDPFALGLLGLVAGLPALALGLFGGHVADRRDRRTIIVLTSAALADLLRGCDESQRRTGLDRPEDIGGHVP